MPDDIAVIRFDPVSDIHASLLRRWLAEPHVRAWWGDPDEELDSILSIGTTGAADGYIVTVDGAPTGYIQSWRPSGADAEPWQRALPTDAVGIDILVGEPGATGSGLGARIVRAFARRLFANGADLLVIDPDPRNDRAIRAYEKAGFVRFTDYPTQGGGPYVMMLTADTYESVI